MLGEHPFWQALDGDVRGTLSIVGAMADYKSPNACCCPWLAMLDIWSAGNRGYLLNHYSWYTCCDRSFYWGPGAEFSEFPVYGETGKADSPTRDLLMRTRAYITQGRPTYQHPETTIGFFPSVPVMRNYLTAGGRVLFGCWQDFYGGIPQDEGWEGMVPALNKYLGAIGSNITFLPDLVELEPWTEENGGVRLLTINDSLKVAAGVACGTTLFPKLNELRGGQWLFKSSDDSVDPGRVVSAWDRVPSGYIVVTPGGLESVPECLLFRNFVTMRDSELQD